VDQKFWRLRRQRQVKAAGLLIPASEEPVDLAAFWYGLPRDVNRIDAVYERLDHRIVFFVGPNYYVMRGNTRLESGPRPLTDLGLPQDLKKVDGALRWGWNDKTYFFSGSMYWRYDEVVGHVELDYPRDISMWTGVPSGIDSVFRNFDGKTYFFKGRKFWEFDDTRMRVVQKSPSPSHPASSAGSEDNSINVRWLQCPPRELIQDPFREDSTINQSHRNAPSIYFATLTTLAVILNF